MKICGLGFKDTKHANEDLWFGFRRYQACNMKICGLANMKIRGLVDFNMKTKQNKTKQTTLLHR
jgi:hypothetical protein